ncbi:MAG: hypothetical protein R3Y10_13220 [Ferrimonas sp.]
MAAKDEPFVVLERAQQKHDVLLPIDTAYVHESFTQAALIESMSSLQFSLEYCRPISKHKSQWQLALIDEKEGYSLQLTANADEQLVTLLTR